MKLYQIKDRGEPELAFLNPDNQFVLLEDCLGKPCHNLSEFFSYDRNLREQMLLSGDRAAGCRSFLLNEVSVCSPISGAASDIICIAENYAEGSSLQSAGNVDIVYFSKHFSCAVGNNEAIPSHRELVRKLDYETELLVILGEDVCDVSETEAMRSVFGYSVINDVSARDLQAAHKQWYRGKSLDGFTAVGPCIVTADEIPDIHALEIRTTVNGEIRQQSNTGCMIKKIGAVISELSQGMTLRAGTLIATGTPSGCGKDQSPPQFLQSGDTVSCYIENIGTLTNRIE